MVVLMRNVLGPNDESFVEHTHLTRRHFKLSILIILCKKVNEYLSTIVPQEFHCLIHGQPNPHMYAGHRNNI